VTASSSTAQIKDADTEINGAHHQWADLVAHPELATAGTSYLDLQSALAHEMGHLIGLDHPCVPAGTNPRPVDNLGTPVPDCSSAPAAVMATTMFPAQTPGDVSKRDLAPDDQQAVCDIYPASAALPCVAQTDGGATDGGTTDGGGTTGTGGTTGGGGATGAAGTTGASGATGAAGRAGGGGATGVAGTTGGSGTTGGGGCGCRLDACADDRAAVLLIGVMMLLAWRRRLRC
jgi:hypothetical protein